MNIDLPKVDPWLIAAIIAWSLFWKGMALWRAARNEHRRWFVAILIINTAGLLEILYLSIWGQRRPPWGWLR